MDTRSENRGLTGHYPIVWPLQIEIDLHNLSTAVSDRDRQNSRSKTLFFPTSPTVSGPQCCIAAAPCAVKAVRWLVLAMAVLAHAGVESLRGIVLLWA